MELVQITLPKNENITNGRTVKHYNTLFYDKNADNTHLEACRAPVHEEDRFLGLEIGDGFINVSRCDVATEEQAAGHVLATPRIALHQLVRRFETCVG